MTQFGTKAAVGRVLRDLNQRPAKWLHRAAEAMVKATLEDWKGWARSGRSAAVVA